MGVDAPEAETLMKAWLGSGFFSPDDLATMARKHGLRPAYLPFWIFDFDVTVHWQGLFGSGSGRNVQWEWRKDRRILFYKNHAQPGVRALPLKLFRKIEPFDFSALVAHKPEYLAGWPAVTYDLPLADAVVFSTAARERPAAAAGPSE